ncbi:MAG: DUF4179 domain-containing protein [Clostridiales bacterium]|nr:DUF4179 domain-containing protein [Clostridiales bacterium]
MNRMEEYEKLLQELDTPVPGLEQTLDRAQTRQKHRRRILRSITGCAAVFACFVLLVNFCTPVAYACSKVPFLRELAEAVTFSPSLTAAVDHQYAQPLYLRQTDRDVTASIEYLIVDQKQVNVFYRLDSDIYEYLHEDATILSPEGDAPPPCAYYLNETDIPNGELRSITIDFDDENVPDSLRLQLDIRDLGAWQKEEIVPAAPTEAALWDDTPEAAPAYIAHFDFLLKFDPAFTATGKRMDLNHTVSLDGQNITFTDLEIYPTHLRINVVDHPDNSAWLKSLNFYIETDWDMKFEPISNGISATGSQDSPMMCSYRADSTYFYDARHLKLVITEAEWLDKDREYIHLNLQTGEADHLPEGVELDQIQQKGENWLLHFKALRRKPHHSHQLFTSIYYDSAGKEYNRSSWSVTDLYEDDGTEISEYFTETFPLQDYPYSEVWLCPSYTRLWTAEEPIIITVH